VAGFSTKNLSVAERITGDHGRSLAIVGLQEIMGLPRSWVYGRSWAFPDRGFMGNHWDFPEIMWVSRRSWGFTGDHGVSLEIMGFNQRSWNFTGDHGVTEDNPMNWNLPVIMGYYRRSWGFTGDRGVTRDHKSS